MSSTNANLPLISLSGRWAGASVPGVAPSPRGGISAGGILLTRRVGDSSTRTESVPSLSPLEPFSQAREIVDEDGWAALFVRGLGTRLLVNALQAALFTVLWKTIEDVLVNGGGPGWLTFAAAGSPGL